MVLGSLVFTNRGKETVKHLIHVFETSVYIEEDFGFPIAWNFATFIDVFDKLGAPRNR